MIIAYTDGSGVNNSKHKNFGFGGFGSYIIDNDKEFYLSEGYENTTSNRMEIMAVLKTLQSIKNKSRDLLIYSDSKYVINSIMEGWINNWYTLNWNTCKNPDLWKLVLKELESFRKSGGKVVLKHLRGHQEDLSNKHVLGNNIADTLASYLNFTQYIYDDRNLKSI